MEQKRYNAPELLAPVGDMERLISAVRYGADAVYLAGKSFGMRSAPSNFTNEELEEAVKYCHAQGVKVYVTCNILPHNAELAALPAFLEFCQAIGVDAFIMTDLGVMSMAKKYAPNVAIHISTQAGVVNYETANAFYNMGAERVVLARELSFEEIAEIRAKTPKALEIEAFVHGAMCISFSGRCLLSNYMTGRDANHGDCAQPCRTGFYSGHEPGQTVNSGGYIRGWDVAAVCTGEENGMMRLSQRNRFFRGETVSVLEPGEVPYDLTLSEIYNEDMEPIESAPHATMTVYLKTDRKIKEGAFLRVKRG